MYISVALEKNNKWWYIIKILCKAGFTNPVAFEVYPAKENIVDNLDVYHLWVMEKNKIPFFIDVKIPRLVLKQKSIKINGKHLLYTQKYYRLQNGRFVQVYYVRAADGTELKWYDKQNFKDLVIDENIVAIEFTVERYQKYSVLVCVPKELKKLPFGLRGWCQRKGSGRFKRSSIFHLDCCNISKTMIY